MSAVRLNKAVLEAAQQKNNWSDSELAQRAGISRSQIWRVKLPAGDKRRNDPGVDLIAGLLKAFENLTFDDLFTLEDDEQSPAHNTA